ncbi:disintegrin and metalloproteinase domain-containing protein 9 isoform X2 [Bombina bombina]|uniref:disintegrin and metalloproteinase domain-containing protein 9 isoform X2 n=1 Tax=Bombina bombina TaxID=8345 RepID=UPI00235A5972|nr:disintegrin and metalloproteinase domain-containing protein 9 isoform X2 [Bombina bombina]
MWERLFLQTLLWILVWAYQVSAILDYEIVIPQRIANREKRDLDPHQSEQWEENLQYSINTLNRTFLLRLQRNRDFVSKEFERFTYSVGGGLQSFNRTALTHSCYYHGEVEGIEGSILALSTCRGLSGVMYMGENHYRIEPIETSSQGEHRLFQLEEPSMLPMCGVKDFNTSMPHLSLPLSYGLRRKRAVLATTSFVELGVVVDKARYDYKNANMTAVEQETLELINIVDGFFKPLNIRTVVTNLLVWTSENPINVNAETAGGVLGNFADWIDHTKGLKKTDIYHLLIGRGSYSGVIGMAFVGTVCSPSLSASISSFDKGKTTSSHAGVVAHELGHNLGLSHDDSPRCTGGPYIMASTDSGGKTFSTCSADDFESLILRGGGLCLRNPPDPNQVLSIPVCGNNVVDRGEECDCGSPQECQNPCCNAATCRLTSGSQCAQGLCCENCKFKVGGTLCRPTNDPCDLPEYCNGAYALCPVDVYIMNGFPCNNSQFYCYSGVCQTFDGQCRALFGEGSSKGNDSCFQKANLNGDRYGNCGMSGTSYKKCSKADSLCGKLQCTGDVKPILNAQVTTFYMEEKYKCTSVDFSLGTDVPDPGLVHQGTACGEGKACVNYQCQNASLLGYSCDVKTQCNDHGVCNNNGNCHCNDGWAPPNCNRAGYGGSIDSGPAHIDTSLRDGLLVFFLLVLPILIVVAFAVIKRDAIRRRFCRRRRRNRGGNGQQQPQSNNANRNVPRSEPQNTYSDIFTISHQLPQRPQNPPIKPQPPLRPPPPRPVTTPQYNWNNYV